jgi:hypothetical protein
VRLALQTVRRAFCSVINHGFGIPVVENIQTYVVKELNLPLQASTAVLNRPSCGCMIVGEFTHKKHGEPLPGLPEAPTLEKVEP